MKKNYAFILLTAFAFIFTSCSISNQARMNNSQRDVLAVQSSFEIKQSVPAIETTQLDKIAPEAISVNNEMLTKNELKQTPKVNAFETPSRKSVRAEMQQFTREQKKEIRKAILYAYLGKEMPEPQHAQKGGVPYVDQTAAAIIAFFIPPLGAGLYFGKDKRTWISLGLTFLFWLPGAIYAIIMILRD